jgi:hypothetical protein
MGPGFIKTAHDTWLEHSEGKSHYAAEWLIDVKQQAETFRGTAETTNKV